MEVRLKASQEDTDRLRIEREALRERASELQIKLREKEAEVRVSDEMKWYVRRSVAMIDET